MKYFYFRSSNTSRANKENNEFFGAEQEGSFFKSGEYSGDQSSFFGTHPSQVQAKSIPDCSNDRLEMKAESMAEAVKGSDNVQRKSVFESEEEASLPAVQKKCAECEQEEKLQKVEEKETPEVMKKAEGEERTDSSGIEQQLKASKGRGAPLSKDTKSSMETAFEADFGGVKVHTDKQAVQMNKSLHAQAFTHGRDIYFGEGKYDDDSKNGKYLLAHELTHVVQQGGTALTNSVQKQPDLTNLDSLNEKLDSFNVPEEEVITLCGQLTSAEKEIVLAGGYRSRMAAALNVGEMVRAMNHLGPVLSTKLEWVNEAAFTTNFIDYSDIKGMVTSAPQSERDVLKINYWKNFFVDVCTNETMVEALDDLQFDLATKLTWLNAEMTITSWELDYATIKPWIIHANTTQAERDALKTESWKSFFVDVCTNETMVEALDDLQFDLATKLTWLNAEMTITSWELDYATIKPWIIHANTTQAERDALKTESWKSFFVDVCTNETMAEAVTDLNFDLTTKIIWIVAEGIGQESIAHIAGQPTADILTAMGALDEATLTVIRNDSALIIALQTAMNNQEFARLAALLILIVPSTVVDKPNARAEALRILSTQLNDKDIARSTIDSSIQVVIIPRDKLMTEIDQFSDLAGKSTFDGRTWDTVRGSRHGNYVAMAEENLLGGSSTATYQGNPVGGGYPVGYSSASHEFSHALHVHILESADKSVITNAYSARKALATANPNDPNQWVDGREGCYASQNEREFFAQLANAYLGVNTGVDAATGDHRHNGKAWVQANEPNVFNILQRIYGTGNLAGANP